MNNDWILSDILSIDDKDRKVRLVLHSKNRIKACATVCVYQYESEKKQIIRELNVMHKLQHENIVQLLDFYETTANCSITTIWKLPFGPELFDLLSFIGHFTEKLAGIYCHQIVNGLKALHALKLFHGSLKPQNLFLDQNFTLKIAHFNFMPCVEKTVKLKTTLSPRGYLPPDLLNSKRHASKKDIFDLGIILFTIYAGFPPFCDNIETDWWWNKLSKGHKYIAAAEKQKTERNKQKHIKAGTAKIALFWRAHERSKYFSASLKHLIENMLHPLPSYRFDIECIENDPWYKCHAIDDDQNQIKQFIEDRIQIAADSNNKRYAKIKAESACDINITHGFKECYLMNTEHVRDIATKRLFCFFTYMSPVRITRRIQQFVQIMGGKTNVSTKRILIETLMEHKVVIESNQCLANELDCDETQILLCAYIRNCSTKREMPLDIFEMLLEFYFVPVYCVTFKRIKGTYQLYSNFVKELLSSSNIVCAMALHTGHSITAGAIRRVRNEMRRINLN